MRTSYADERPVFKKAEKKRKANAKANLGRNSKYKDYLVSFAKSNNKKKFLVFKLKDEKEFLSARNCIWRAISKEPKMSNMKVHGSKNDLIVYVEKRETEL